jgi:uncharacterized repeat protein (TIGR03803 family)
MTSAKDTRFPVFTLHLAFLLSFGLLSVPAQASHSTTKPFFTFNCNSSTKTCPNGQQPTSLIQSADGNFYGTTEFAGNSSQAEGTVFKLSARKQLTTIFSFVGDHNGGNPTSLLEGKDGNLYGTTNFGGANNAGVVFKLSKTGTIQVLHNFCSLAGCADGAQPFNLVLGNDGNLYGATSVNFSPGTLFRVTRKGSYTLLHTFNAEVDGPQGVGMTLASDGNIYGTTQGGSGFPTVLFQLTPAGQVSVLHAWRYPTFPVSPATQVSDGTLRGVLTEITGGAQPAMFSILLSGSGYQEIPLYIPPSRSEVRYMTEASDGNFWGTQGFAILTFTFGGAELQQLPFKGNNGSVPMRLLQASSGTLVGFAGAGTRDEQNPGEIFVIRPSLPAPKPLFVSFNPARGKVGAKVVIQGVHFVGATAVTFNGVKASFRVLNTGNVVATVPGGATTGPVSVTNAGGTTASSDSFVVE